MLLSLISILTLTLTSTTVATTDLSSNGSIKLRSRATPGQLKLYQSELSFSLFLISFIELS